MLSQVVLWHSQGYQPAPIRYVLVVDLQGHYPPEVFFSTDVDLAAAKIVEHYVLRWSLEVTFEEARAHMGLETQRQWSDKAITRTTPALLGLMSLVTIMAHRLKENHPLKPVNSAWYTKDDSELTFSDTLAFVRGIIWRQRYFDKSVIEADLIKLEPNEINSLINQLALAA